MPGAPTPPTSSAPLAPPPCGAPGSPFSLQGLLQDLLVQGLFGHQLLEPCVLHLQLFESLGLVGLHAPVLVPPAVEGRLRHLQLLANLSDTLALGKHPIRLPKLADDLLRTGPFALHRESSLPLSGAVRLSYQLGQLLGSRPPGCRSRR